MAIEDIIKRKVARELQEWVYLGINEGMLQSVRDYKTLKANGREEEALNQLNRAADMPTRAKARIEAAITEYGKDYIEEALKLYGDCTVDEMLDEIETKIKASESYVAGIIDDEKSNDDVADAILSNTESNMKKWVFSIPADYEDVVTKAKKEKEKKAEK